MKVIGILSSPHGKKSVTRPLVEAALAGAKEAGAGTELVDVCRLKINYCKGCHTCYLKGRCPQRDDFQGVLEKVLAADGFVLSSPNYIGNVTAQMKTLMDRMTDVVHSKLLFDKYGFAVATAGGAGEESTIRILNDFLARCGAFSTGGVGYAMSWGPKKAEETREKARQMGAELAAAIAEKRRFPEQEKARAESMKLFAYAVGMNRDLWKHDYDHWVRQGWIKA
ncbi:MAG TPA: flavodoxin family protein [Methanocella sp.]|nr:flavodoxin family protein [Methanocella sp.]